MRVIAGKARGRRLNAPRGMNTRPATARVRASIFSRLEARGLVQGAGVLDIFAGSGSLGLEAMSRGGSEAVFVDSSREAGAAITRNLREFGLEARARVIIADFRRALAQLSAEACHFGLILIDAPFADDSTAEVLALIARLGLLAPNGCVVTRQFHRVAAPAAAEYECINVARIGDHRIALYRRLDSGAPR